MTLDLLLHGFSVALTPANLVAAIIGVVFGTLVGVLPGLGISGAMALLLPISFGLEPLTALVIFAGIYYGAMYGGSTTSILVNVPGEGASVVTCIEGYAMAKKGRAGAALSVAAIGSFIAGTLGLVGLTIAAPQIARWALAFGPPEYLAIAVLGLVVLTGITRGSMVRAGIMVLIGIMLGTVGLDPMTGINRFTMGQSLLSAGVDFVIVVMGAYGLGEVLYSLSEPQRRATPIKVKFRDLYPTRTEFGRAFPAIFRGGILGFLIGLIPGPSATISSFASYSLEKRISKHREEFGHGAIEGVAGPESANNGAESATLIPLLSLGLPFNSSTALLLSAFLIHGITPSPLLISSHADIFWGLVALMFIANVFLLIVNLPFVGVFASLLRTPISILMPLVAVVVLVGGYVINYRFFDLWLLLGFAVLGYVMRLGRYDFTPMVIGLFLGPLIEKSLQQSMVIVDGNPLALFARPLSGTMLSLAVVVIVLAIARAAFGWKKPTFLNSESNPDAVAASAESDVNTKGN
jgi:putative tricarboxylic transport membrane protein